VRSLNLTSVDVSSTFSPLACSPPPGDANPKPDDPNDSNPNDPDDQNDQFLNIPGKGNTPVFAGGPGGPAQVGDPMVSDLMLSRLASLEWAVADLRTMITGRSRSVPAIVTNAAATSASDRNTCFRYLNTDHGPEGLFRRRILTRARVTGAVELLAGLKSFNANVDVLTYIEYSVNTFLLRQPSWTINEKSDDPVFSLPVSLPFTKRCDPEAPAGGPLGRCGSDVVSGNVRVVIRFKKIFIGEIQASGGTPTVNVDLGARLDQLSDESFTGIVSFTHSIPPPPTPAS
jgi:hypothetical protein